MTEQELILIEGSEKSYLDDDFDVWKDVDFSWDGIECLRANIYRERLLIDRKASHIAEVLSVLSGRYAALSQQLEKAREALTEIYEYPSGQPLALGLDEEDWQRRRAEQMRFIARNAMSQEGE